MRKILKAKGIVLATLLGLSMGGQAVAEPLKVGVTTTGIPFTFLDNATQKPTGAMVDLASAIAKQLNDEADFKVSSFSALIPSLKTGRLDLISAGMFISDARKKIVNFSIPVYSYGDALFVKKGEDSIKSLDDLAGEKVGAQIGTVFVDILKKKGGFADIKLYDSLADIMRDIKLGRIKAGLGDAPVVGYQIAQNPKLGVQLARGYKAAQMSNVGIAVAKDNEKLLSDVNQAIQTLRANGEMKQIFEKYGL